MKVSLVSPYPVMPATSGDRIRSVQLLDALRGAGVETSLIAYAWAPAPPAPDDISVTYVPGRPWNMAGRAAWRVRLALARRSNPYVICQLAPARMLMAQAIEAADADVIDIQHSFSWVPTRRPTVLTLHNVLTHQLRREGGHGERHLAGIEAMEREAIEGADAVVTFSALDTARATELAAPRGSIVEVPLGYAPTGAGRRRTQRDEVRVVAYVGSFDYGPNLDAAKFLVDQFPSMKERAGVRSLWLIGRDARRYFRQGDGVEVHSDVRDVGDLLEAIDVLVVPLTSGGGVRVKIIEAFALSVPVLCTDLAIEGLDAEDGVHAIVVSRREELVDALATMRSRPVREALAVNAHERWRQRHRPEAMAERMIELYEQVLRERR